MPIGNDYGNFQGRYDGQGFLIEGLTINTTSNYQGLFGYVQGSEFVGVSSGGRAWVKNVVLQGGSISGGQYTGGIVGYANSYVDILNCKSNVTVKGTSYVGGIAGYLGSNSTLNNCINTGSVTASSNNAGGIGGNISGTITNCVNYGYINGNSSVGGIAGQFSGSSMSSCVSNANVEGSRVGGLIGSLATGNTISNCAVYGHIRVVSGEYGPFYGFGIVGGAATGFSFYGTCNKSMVFYNNSGSRPKLTACWSWCNNTIQVSSNITSDAATWTQYWAVVPGMNYGLPIQKELYAVAEAANSTAAEIAAALPGYQVYS